MKCKRCGEDLINCDGGYAHKFKVGQVFYCHKRRNKKAGNFHFCSWDEVHENETTAVATEVIK